MQARRQALSAVCRAVLRSLGEPSAAAAWIRGVATLQAAARLAGAFEPPCKSLALRSAQAWRPGLSLAHRQALRQFGSAAEEEAAATAAVHDTLRPKILRFFALFMIAGAGANVLPSVAAASVGNCLALMDAETPLMVKAGCSRLQLLMRADSARLRAVHEGAARKLLRLVQAPNADEGVVDYAMAALESLCGCEEGLVSLREEGGAAALQSYLAGVQRSPATEDAVYRAQRLLAALDALGEV